MPWSDPPTFDPGTELAAADLNLLRDNLLYLKGIADGVTVSGVQVTRAAAQSITTSTSTEISFSAEAYDHGGWWSSGPDVTVPAVAIPDGFASIIVHVEGELRFAANGTGARVLVIYVNDAAVEPGRRIAATGGGDSTDFGISRYIEVAAGDVINLRCYQNSGSSLNASAVVFSVMRHAPAATS